VTAAQPQNAAPPPVAQPRSAPAAERRPSPPPVAAATPSEPNANFMAHLLPEEPEPVAAAASAAKGVVWSADPSIQAMRDEIQHLRGMLESQLTSLAWGQNRRQHPQRIRLLEQLTRFGLAPNLASQIADRIRYSDDALNNWRQALQLTADQISTTDDDIVNHGGVVALVGATGVGKTTTIAKLAARYTLRHGTGRVALITTDVYRIGAQQQLQTFGRILGAPVHVANSADELRKTLNSLRDKGLILIDTAGMAQNDLRLAEQFALFDQSGFSIRTYVVLSATSQRAVTSSVIRQLGKTRLDGCILTKLDETASLGESLSVVIEQQLPIAYLATGQRVPEDLEPARSKRLVNRGVTLMQQSAERPTEESLMFAFGNRMGVAAHG
jgi:flagellar biosynthesis protein FlhF